MKTELERGRAQSTKRLALTPIGVIIILVGVVQAFAIKSSTLPPIMLPILSTLFLVAILLHAIEDVTGRLWAEKLFTAKQGNWDE